MLGALALILLVLIFGVGFIVGGPIGGLSGLVVWLSFIVSLKYGTYSDVQVAYMSVILWLIALGLALWYRLFPEKRINALSALLLSYLPPVDVFLLMSVSKPAQYLGLLYILVILALPYRKISRRFPLNDWNKAFMLAMGLQIVIVGVVARSLYVLPYALVLWWWYTLTIRSG